jgi:hypothetical protein
MTARIVSVRGSGLTLWGVRPKPLAPRPIAKVLDTSRGRFEIDAIDVGDHGWSARMKLECTDGSWHGRSFDMAEVTNGFARYATPNVSSVPWPAFTTTSWVQYTGRPANTYWSATTTKPHRDAPRARKRPIIQQPAARNAVPPAADAAARVAASEPDTSARPT